MTEPAPAGGETPRDEVWGEGRLSAHPVGKPPAEATKVELKDREIPWERALEIGNASAWGKLQTGLGMRLHRVFRSTAGQLKEPEWFQKGSQHLLLYPIRVVEQDGVLQENELVDGWVVEELPKETRLAVFDAEKGGASDDALLTHRDRVFGDEFFVKWHGVKKLDIQATTPDGTCWSAELELPDKPRDEPRPIYVILRSDAEA
jgi:hypothetical protein